MELLLSISSVFRVSFFAEMICTVLTLKHLVPAHTQPPITEAGRNHSGVLQHEGWVQGGAIPAISFLVESHQVREGQSGGAKRDRDLSSAPFPGEI